MNISFGNGDGSFGLICFGSIVLVVAVFLVVSAISAKNRKKKMLGMIGQLGFTSQPQPDADFTAALAALYAPSRVQKVSNLARKLFGDENYYLFDVTTLTPQTSSESAGSSSTEYSNVGILSPHLNLPPFLLMQRMSAPGKLGGMIDNLLVFGAMNAGFHELKQVTTAFQLNYMLFIKDDARAAEVFTDQVLDRIAMLDHVIARGEGRLLVFNRFEVRNNGKLDENGLAQQVQLARQLCDMLVV